MHIEVMGVQLIVAVNGYTASMRAEIHKYIRGKAPLIVEEIRKNIDFELDEILLSMDHLGNTSYYQVSFLLGISGASIRNGVIEMCDAEPSGEYETALQNAISILSDKLPNNQPSIIPHPLYW